TASDPTGGNAVLETSFVTTAPANDGLVVTVEAPNGYRFRSEDTPEYAYEILFDGVPVDVESLSVSRPHVVLIVADTQVNAPAGTHVELVTPVNARPPVTTFANTDFAVRTAESGAAAHPERGNSAGQEGGGASAVGEARLSVDSQAAGGTANWAYQFMTRSSLEPLSGRITITAPSGTQ